MADNQWILTDSCKGISLQNFEICSDDVPGTPRGWKVSKRTLRGGLCEGVEIIEIHNGLMIIFVIPTRGMGISHIRIGGETLGWKSPILGPVNPQYVPINEPTGMGWLDGFTELMCRCGLESNGTPVFDERNRLVFPLHGRIANRPAHFLKLLIDAERGEIQLQGIVDESRFHFQKLRLVSTFVTRFHSNTLRWGDRVENLSELPAKMQMLYHINVGSPLLEEGARLVAPVKQLAPFDHTAVEAGVENWHTYPGPYASAMQQSYFAELLSDSDSMSQVLLRNRAGNLGMDLHFSTRDLPCFAQWRNITSERDGYVTAIEPGTNFPNPRPFEEQHGRLISLSPREVWSTSVQLNWHTSPEEVEKAQSAIISLQETTKPLIHKEPLKNWSGPRD